MYSGNLENPVTSREIRPLWAQESYGVEVELPGISEKKKDHELVLSTSPRLYRIKNLGTERLICPNYTIKL